MSPTFPANEGERLQKVLARRGFGARRKIEQLIERGAVSVNGHRVALGARVKSGDEIVIQGRRVHVREAPPTRVIMMHKPCGFVVSRNAQAGQRPVFDLLPDDFGLEWVTVGRLDIDTSGLLFLTNDGRLANALMHPSSEVPRVYRVLVEGRVGYAMLRRMLAGVTKGARVLRFDSIETGKYIGNEQQWFIVSLHQGRNREVRRLWASQGGKVRRLIRTAYAMRQLDVAPGAWRELTPAEVDDLSGIVGLREQRQYGSTMNAGELQ